MQAHQTEPSQVRLAYMERNEEAEALLPAMGQIANTSLALLTLALAALLPRTRLSNTGPLIAIALPSVLAVILRWGDVRVVRDIGEITGGIPAPFWPSP